MVFDDSPIMHGSIDRSTNPIGLSCVAEWPANDFIRIYVLQLLVCDVTNTQANDEYSLGQSIYSN